MAGSGFASIGIIDGLDSVKLLKRHQLALYNGQDKPAIYVAWQGRIYDMTTSRLWKNGKHYEHWAGQDLTEELANAPHAEEVFDKFLPIGELVE